MAITKLNFSGIPLTQSELVIASSVAALLGFLTLLVGVVSQSVVQFGALGRLSRSEKQHGSYHKRLAAYLQDAESLYRNGYGRFKDGIYRITTTDGERVMIPNKYLDELKAQPEKKISNKKALVLAAECKYTGLPKETDFLNHLVRADLTKNLAKINPRLVEEVERTVKRELPEAEDWTPVKINDRLLHIIAIVSGNAFLGPDLCRREEYLHASIKYATEVFSAVRALKRWPKILRPIGQLFIPQLGRIADHRERAKAFFLPVIRDRRARMERGEQVPDDMLQWMLLKSKSFNIHDDAELAFQQLSLTLASIHSTAATLTQMIYDIVARPDIVPVLREEIKSALQEHGGDMSTQALFSMKVLDSVMRESQRMNPLSMARFSRYVEEPVTLSDGTKIPAHVVVEAPFIAIARDPQFYPEPETFDPYRFSRLRSGEARDPIGYKSPEQYQFVAVAKENLNFGFGRNACPGRFFAANEIKLILARLLLDFDLKMPGGRTERFDNIVIAGGIVPDTSKEILLRKIRGDNHI